MENTDSIITRTADHILWIELNRPNSLNATNADMLCKITTAITDAERNPDIRCVLITASGRAFCVGQNLKDIISTDPPPVRELLEKGFHPLIEAISNSPLPIFCGVNGLAVGAGFSIALACDLVLASDNATFQLGFSKIGFIPDAGCTFALVKLIGRHRSAGLITTDEKLNALQAKEIGLVAEIFPADSFAEVCEKYLRDFTKQSFSAMSSGKKLLRAAESGLLRQQLNLEADAQVKLSCGSDFKEGVAAFLEKRPPVFNQKTDV